MNCIKDGKYTGESCFGCKIKIEDCEIRDKVYRKRWIPVSEREPRQNETVIATIKSNNEEFVIITVYYCEEWKHGEWKMVAWKPLPEPYKEVIE